MVAEVWRDLRGLAEKTPKIKGDAREKTVRLQEYDTISDDRDPGQYTTWSRFQGKKGTQNRLLKSEYISFASELPWISLPQTFQEALEVASALGCEYSNPHEKGITIVFRTTKFGSLELRVQLIVLVYCLVAINLKLHYSLKLLSTENQP